MNLLENKVEKLYMRYLIPSMGGAIVTSIYSFVDTIAIGQSMGPEGAAAVAVITPLFGVIYFLGILCGIGGSVLMSKSKGEGKIEKGNAYFTASLVFIGTLSVVFWILFGIFSRQIFTLFGADAKLMPLVMEYAKWLIIACPFFLLSIYLSCLIRNDNAPNLVMKAVITGGLLNIFGDWFFVFPLHMGIGGAGLATALGTVLQTVIMCSHFFSKKCGLKLVKVYKWRVSFCRIAAAGFGAGLLDIALIVLTCILNNQVMHYGGPAAMAVFGIVITVSSLFQHLFSGVGQAVQPIVSTNYGANKIDRIKRAYQLSMTTVILLGMLFAAIGLLFPTQIMRLFMEVTPEVLAVAPTIVRIYFLSFLFMGVNILSTFYLQSIMRTKMSTIIAFLRGIVLGGVLLYAMPLIMGIRGVWWAMVFTEGIVAAIALIYLRRVHLENIR